MSLEKSVVLPCDAEKAFRLFTERAGEWWPSDRRHAGDPASEIRMLPQGRFYERARDGREVDLGRVREWEPPRRVLLDFYVGTDAEHPTEVEVLFAAEAGGTRVTVLHRPGAAGELWDARAPRFAASWDKVLEALLNR